MTAFKRVAGSLEELLRQVNAAYPGRSKISDGALGDTSHSARVSDHNPDAAGVVHARDFTHDPAAGFDSYAFADRLLAEQDPRMKYVISDRRIGSGPAGPAPGLWRPYTGINPHQHHAHVSVVSGGPGDRETPWAGVTTHQEMDMPLTEAEITKIADATRAEVLSTGVQVGKDMLPLGLALGRALAGVNRTEEHVKAQAATIAAQSVAITALSKAQGLDPTVIEAAVSTALDQWTLTLTPKPA